VDSGSSVCQMRVPFPLVVLSNETKDMQFATFSKECAKLAME
jgi:hypothetical protein